MLRPLRAALLALVVAPALVVSALPASASPPPTPPPPSESKINVPNAYVLRGTAKVSSGEYTFVKLASKATDPKHVDSKGRIDWNWVQKVFGKHTTSRDGFGAGWWAYNQNWSKFTHLSKKDKKGIIAWGKTHDVGPNPKRVTDLVLKKAPKPCDGVTKLQVTSVSYYDWLNSCDTAKLIARGKVCSAIVGLGGLALSIATKGKTALPVAVALAMCAGGAAWLDYAAGRSTLAAVIMRVDRTVVKNGSKYQVPFWMYPQ